VARPRLTCNHCGEVIGVYESIVVMCGGQPRETSRAMEPTVGSDPGELYHQACYQERVGKTPAPDSVSLTGVS
jgi:hypothetical protein